MADGNSPRPRIAFVGAGNMATSIIGGLIESGHPADLISAADPVPASLERLRELGPIALHEDNAAAATGADVIILAVKPQVMAEAAESIAGAVRDNKAVVLSIAGLQRGLPSCFWSHQPWRPVSAVSFLVSPSTVGGAPRGLSLVGLRSSSF